ncbi:MAG: ATP-binding protein [Tannerellaceae bacterium]
MQRTLNITNKVEELAAMNKFLLDICKELAISETLTMKLNLVMEEIVANIIMYAYNNTPVESCINITVHETSGLLTFTFADEGIPFDPTLQPNPNITLPADKRAIGGLGIFLVRSIMDGVTYKRWNGQNLLTTWIMINKQQYE